MIKLSFVAHTSQTFITLPWCMSTPDTHSVPEHAKYPIFGGMGTRSALSEVDRA